MHRTWAERWDVLPSGPPEPFRGVVTLAIWFGLVVGLAEVFARTVQALIFRQWRWVSEHVVWMAPVGDVVFFVGFVLIFWLLGQRWPALLRRPVIVCVFTFVAAAAPLLFISALHKAAAVLLAAGIAAQATRLVRRGAVLFDAVIRRTTVPLAALAVALTIAVITHHRLAEQRALAALPPAASGSANVILIVLDTVRAANVGFLGYPRKTTPELDEFARKGVVFERAVSTAPWTLPSHASMFTGRYPFEVSANWLSALDDRFATLAETLRDRGYLTAGFVANLLYLMSETGIARGFLKYDDYPVTTSMVVQSSWLWRLAIEPILIHQYPRRWTLLSKTAGTVTDDVLSWLDENQTRPFFLFLNYFDAHDPYAVPATFEPRFGSGQPRPSLATQRTWSTGERQVELDAYDTAIAYIDQQLGVLFRELDRRGLLDNTLVIVTSDHGELFGEHGLFSHANSLYRPLLHVPLLVVFPSRVPAGRRVSAPVTLRDLPATIADLLALPGRPFPGHSLTAHWMGATFGTSSASAVLSEVDKGVNAEPWLPVARGRMRSVVRDGHHYILSGDGKEELYDFMNDPAEAADLVQSPAASQKLVRIRAWLQSLSHVGVNAFGPDTIRSHR